MLNWFNLFLVAVDLIFYKPSWIFVFLCSKRHYVYMVIILDIWQITLEKQSGLKFKPYHMFVHRAEAVTMSFKFKQSTRTRICGSSELSQVSYNKLWYTCTDWLLVTTGAITSLHYNCKQPNLKALFRLTWVLHVTPLRLTGALLFRLTRV